ncbi:MAG: hypothetical protein Q9227_006952 [Pyrenula ochraceoflavens]
MRTSRLSRETAQLFTSSVSPLIDSSIGRTTRNALKTFSHGTPTALKEKEHDQVTSDSREETSLDHSSCSVSGDIEDASTPLTSISTVDSERSVSRKRKRGGDNALTSNQSSSRVQRLRTPTKVSALKQTVKPSPRRSARKNVQVKAEVELEPELADNFKEEGSDADSIPASLDTPRSKAKPKVPARKVVAEDGSVTIHPPSNWSEVYSIIKEMREANPTAPVDTMGCEDLFWRSSPPREKRYHTLTALMLSSQTKDTVTAAAMQRLHKELVEDSKSVSEKQSTTQGPSQLTIGNVIACEPSHLDSLIQKVGFHNNKTKYIKAAAIILRDQYNSEIPSTIEGLISLPGVGPKMAYLCMSAAWGIDEGIGVDVHVHRITNLWGWHKTKSPEETRAWLEGWLPKDKWHDINKMLVGLGQTVCLPVGRRCGECWLSGKGLCKSEIRGLKAKVKVEKKATIKQEDG